MWPVTQGAAETGAAGTSHDPEGMRDNRARGHVGAVRGGGQIELQEKLGQLVPRARRHDGRRRDVPSRRRRARERGVRGKRMSTCKYNKAYD